MAENNLQPILLWRDSIYWLGTRAGDSFLAYNSYALIDGDDLYIIDPGSRERWPRIEAAAHRILAERGRSFADTGLTLVLTGSSVGAAGCLDTPGSPDAPDAQFSGSPDAAESRPFPSRIIGHWKSGLLLGQTASFFPLSNYRPYIQLNGERQLRMHTLVNGERDGNIMLQDSLSGLLFSGAMFGSMGKTLRSSGQGQPVMLTRKPDSRQLGAMKHYQQQLGDNRWVEHLLRPEHSLWDSPPRMVLPRNGVMYDSDPAQLLSSLHARMDTLPESFAEPMLQPGQNMQDLLREIDSLRRTTFDLQESMVVMQDERIRDTATGLYNSRFFDEYYPLFCDENPDNSALIYASLDGVVQLNQEFGPEEGDAAIAAFSRILSGIKPSDSMLFRMAGPLCCLLLKDTDYTEAEMLAQRIRQAVREFAGFSRPMTCSVGFAATSEVGSIQQLQPAADARIAYAREQGGDILCGRIPEAQSGDSQGQTRVLLLETDPLTAGFLRSFLESHGCLCRVCGSGVEAYGIMQQFAPDVVAAELFLQGVDALSLREQTQEDVRLSDIPWILYSYQKNGPVVTRAQHLGIYHYLRKPIVLTELLGLVQRVAGRSADRDTE